MDFFFDPRTGGESLPDVFNGERSVRRTHTLIALEVHPRATGEPGRGPRRILVPGVADEGSAAAINTTRKATVAYPTVKRLLLHMFYATRPQMLLKSHEMV